MDTMDDYAVNDTKQTYLRDYEGDRVKAAIMYCRDSLSTEAARRDRDQRRSVVEIATQIFELSLYQRAVVEEHV